MSRSNLAWTMDTMETSSDEEESRTFVQVLSEKYNPENFPYGQGVMLEIGPTSQRSVFTWPSWTCPKISSKTGKRLEELFLCLNGFNTVSESQTSCPSLRLLQITDNQLQEWKEVRKFGQIYPSLNTLVLANNSVDSEGSESEGIPLLKTYTDQERCSLLLAQLPSVVLNGSMVPRPRIKVRSVGPAGGGGPEPPQHHGGRSLGEKVEAMSLHLEQTVAELRKHIRALLQLPHHGIRLFYINREMCSVFGPEELKCGTRALHSYRIQDGDEILVVPKVKSRSSTPQVFESRSPPVL
ncbi:hypothetical protein F7725_006496 [Dissostichus mawsoni]|uniref:Ubiquitin-like domain-containing protein n=1 Tax=Dissostichus mawsoni TaxID=36200 RepID=A0A7J5XU22_DISMA|nr:hypothetical protein F7725_006496 [Dissostichus mawsoni]